MKNKLLENRGLTLVELLITVAILGIMISFMFTFFHFNYDTFFRSATKYTTQTNLNEAIRIVEEELRFADRISIYDEKEFENNKNYIYIKDSGIKIKKANNERINLNIDDIVINVEESCFKLNKNLITMDIKVEYKSHDEEFRIKYTMELLNFNSDNDLQGSIIEYSEIKGDDTY
ncbi:PilW family protein [Clostridium sp. Cult2]|uniref:PilW family protein n=1 Tax=Clostridium sp. Cult2 TaxID=2079003 RepID=UPI001F1CA6A6|nr:prepilin-type N-terminal cleavage/methylation domain-containing protein [Clostridium sp. Cult2]